MQETTIEGVYKKADKLYTQNPVSAHGIRVYNEKLYTHGNKEYRSWNPYRSKLAAAIKKKITIDFSSSYDVLYLGAAMGTTVSHIADIVTNGIVYAVEHTPLAMNSLLQVSAKRKNIIPILHDANHPDRYTTIVNMVDILYQDISQRNQAEIYIENSRRYLKKQGVGILMVKARSIDVALKPKEVYEQVTKQLNDAGMIIHSVTELSPYDKDHAMIKSSWQ
jgi:fibrillarin-like pre-rRNA processing protein